MKTTRRILSMLLCLALVLGVIPVFASAAEETATLSFASTAQRESQTTTKQVWKNGGVTFTNNKGSSSSNVANYSNPVRLYANSEIVVDHAGMTQIVFDCNSSSYATALKNSIGTVSGATVTVSSDKVTVKFTSAVDTFKVAKLSAQIRIDSLTVTYTTDSEGGEPACECTNTSVEHKDGKHIEICDDCGEPVATSYTVTTKYDSTAHWEECSCRNYKTTEVAHTLVNDECTCGYYIPVAFEKVTVAPSDWSGTYLIVHEAADGKYYVFNAAATELDSTSNYVSNLVAVDGIINAKADMAVVIEKVGDAYAIKAGNIYIGNTSTSNDLNTSSTASTYTNILTMNDDNTVNIGATTGNTNLRFYLSGGSSRFRWYSTNQKTVSLYKLVENTSGGETPDPDVPVEGDQFEKVTSADGLVSGKYIMVAGNNAAPGVFGEYSVLPVTPTMNGDICIGPAGAVWELKVVGNTVTLTDSNGVTIAPGENSDIMQGDYSWSWAFADGAFTFKTNDDRTFASNSGAGNQFRAYSDSTITDAYYSTFTLYKLVEETPAVPAFDSAAPVLKNDLAMNFYVPKAMFENTGYTNPYAVFNFDGNDYTVSTSTEATVNEVAMLVFTFKNIAPHKADTTITYTLKSTYNGEEVSSESGTYSVLEYCTKKLKAQDSSEKLKTLVSDLLNYCAAVQTSLGKTPLDTSAIEGFAPTTAEVTLTSCKAVTENNIENPVAAWDTATLILKDKVIVRFYFAAESIDGLSVKIAGAKNATITEIKQEGDLYYVDFTGLLATDMRKQITATVHSGDTAVSETVTYSIESYAASYQNVAANGMGALVKAMMKYGDSAENYQ